MNSIGGTYRLTFFSDSRLESLSTKLRNNKVNDLVGRISAVLKNRVRSPYTESTISSVPESGQVDHTSAARYITGKPNAILICAILIVCSILRASSPPLSTPGSRVLRVEDLFGKSFNHPRRRTLFLGTLPLSPCTRLFV